MGQKTRRVLGVSVGADAYDKYRSLDIEIRRHILRKLEQYFYHLLENPPVAKYDISDAPST